MEEIRSGEIPGGLHAGMEWIENRGLCASMDCLDSGFGGELRSSSDSGCSSNTWIGRGECTSGSVDSFRDELLADQQEAEVQGHQGWEKRPRLGYLADDQEETTENPTALEKALKSFATRKH
ncbi:hypothetical protein PVAP13_3KG386727 [Panicum virgatum]|uniref:Uncharacterized protein n=1 Tax=Panicum virgatum TaxID=38727 RepID=A0A8T0UW76_PANVG|nr:hypothetical protein PVAP13_3KG386727 [Panicum virgatum]